MLVLLQVPWKPVTLPLPPAPGLSPATFVSGPRLTLAWHSRLLVDRGHGAEGLVWGTLGQAREEPGDS